MRRLRLVTLALLASCSGGGGGDSGGDETPATESSEYRGATSEYENGSINVVQLENGTTVTAPDNENLEGSSISFPPGSLAIPDANTKLFVEEAAPLAEQGVLSDVGVEDEAQVDQQGGALLAVPSGPVTVVEPFQVALSGLDAAGLTTLDNETVAVLYKTVVGTEFTSGLLPASSLTFEGDSILFSVSAFGAYQVVRLNRAYDQPLAGASQSKAIANVRWENAADEDGLGKPLVSLRPLARTFPLELSAAYRYFINGTTASEFPLQGRCSEAGSTVVISGLHEATLPCQDYAWSTTADFSGVSDGEQTLQLTMKLGQDLDQETFTIFKDTVAPTLTLTDPLPSTISGSPVEISFQIADLEELTFTKNDGPGTINFGSHTQSTTSLGYRVSVDTAGTYDVTAKAYDLAENTTSMDLSMNFLSASAVVEPETATLSISYSAGATSVGFSLTPQGDFDHNSNGFGGYLIVRRAGTAVSWSPTDGTDYTAGSFVDADHKVVALAANEGGISDSGLIYGQTYHYKAFPYNIQKTYAAGSSANVAIQVLTNTQVGWAGGYMVDTHVADNKLFVAKDSRGFELYDIGSGNETAPSLLGGLDRSDDVVSIFAAAISSTTYAFLLEEQNGITIVDISSPQSMSVVGTLHPEEYATYRGIHVSGDYAYITTFSNMYIIDVNPPSSPTLTGTLGISQPVGVHVDGNVAYVAGSGFVSTVDITTKASPSVSDTYSNGSYGFIDITKIGTDLFVTLNASGNDGIMKIDVNDPNSIGSSGVYTPADSGGGVGHIDHKGSNPIFADGTAGVYTADTTPASPGGTNSVNTDGTAKSVSVNGNYAYVADNDVGLNILDITSASSVSSAGTIATLSNAEGVAVSGNYIYVADAWNGLMIYDISTLATPLFRGQFKVTNGYAYSVVVSGTEAYVAFDDEGMYAIDVSTVTSPSEANKDNALDDIKHVTAAGSHLLFSMNTGSGSGGVYVKNTSMSTVGSATGFDAERTVYDGSRYAYTITGNSSGNDTLRVIDLQTPSSPNVIKSYDLGSASATGVDFQSDYVFVTINDTNPSPATKVLKIINVSDPANPSETSSIQLTEAPKGVKASGDLVHIPSGGGGVALIYIDDISAPFAYGTMQVSYDARGIDIVGNYVYVADGYDGITIHDKITP